MIKRAAVDNNQKLTVIGDRSGPGRIVSVVKRIER
jgi:hypothetical protein